MSENDNAPAETVAAKPKPLHLERWRFQNEDGSGMDHGGWDLKLDMARVEKDGLKGGIASTIVNENGEVVAIATHRGNDFKTSLTRVNALLALIAKAPEMMHCLLTCRGQFAFYEEQHLAKNTEDGNRKAAVNRGLVTKIDELLKEITG